MVITLGGVHKFRFNHPAEAAILRERRRVRDPQVPFMLIVDVGGNNHFFFFFLLFDSPQASEVGMSCTYIDLCPLTPDGRYMQPLNINLSCTERSFCPPSSYFISGVIVYSTASRMWSSKGSWMPPSHMLGSLLSGST